MKIHFIAPMIILSLVIFPGCTNTQKKTPVVTKSPLVVDTVFDSLKRSVTNPASPVEDSAHSSPALSAKISDTVAMGAFTYVVDHSSFSKTIRSDALHETARGIFLLVTLTFINRDRQSHVVGKPLINLTDENHNVYECSAPAADVLAMAGKSSFCSRECRSGETVMGTIVFDVPSKDRGYHLTVSNGAWRETTRDIFLAIRNDTVSHHGK